MNKNDIDIWSVELPPPEEPEEAPATLADTRTWQVLSVIGRALFFGFVIMFSILMIWGPSARTDHQ